MKKNHIADAYNGKGGTRTSSTSCPKRRAAFISSQPGTNLGYTGFHGRLEFSGALLGKERSTRKIDLQLDHLVADLAGILQPERYINTPNSRCKSLQFRRFFINEGQQLAVSLKMNRLSPDFHAP